MSKESPWPQGSVRPASFEPKWFPGGNCSIYEQDERSLALAEVNLSTVKLVTCLKKGEARIKGQERLKRLKQAGHILLDARFCLAIWNNEELIPKSWRGKDICFDGTVLQHPRAGCGVMCLSCWGDECGWGLKWLKDVWYPNQPSAVLVAA